MVSTFSSRVSTFFLYSYIIFNGCELGCVPAGVVPVRFYLFLRVSTFSSNNPTFFFLVYISRVGRQNPGKFHTVQQLAGRRQWGTPLLAGAKSAFLHFCLASYLFMGRSAVGGVPSALSFLLFVFLF